MARWMITPLFVNSVPGFRAKARHPNRKLKARELPKYEPWNHMGIGSSFHERKLCLGRCAAAARLQIPRSARLFRRGEGPPGLYLLPTISDVQRWALGCAILSPVDR